MVQEQQFFFLDDLVWGKTFQLVSNFLSDVLYFGLRPSLLRQTVVEVSDDVVAFLGVIHRFNFTSFPRNNFLHWQDLLGLWHLVNSHGRPLFASVTTPAESSSIKALFEIGITQSGLQISKIVGGPPFLRLSELILFTDGLPEFVIAGVLTAHGFDGFRLLLEQFLL